MPRGWGGGGRGAGEPHRAALSRDNDPLFPGKPSRAPHPSKGTKQELRAISVPLLPPLDPALPQAPLERGCCENPSPGCGAPGSGPLPARAARADHPRGGRGSQLTTEGTGGPGSPHHPALPRKKGASAEPHVQPERGRGGGRCATPESPLQLPLGEGAPPPLLSTATGASWGRAQKGRRKKKRKKEVSGSWQLSLWRSSQVKLQALEGAQVAL